MVLVVEIEVVLNLVGMVGEEAVEEMGAAEVEAVKLGWVEVELVLGVVVGFAVVTVGVAKAVEEEEEVEATEVELTVAAESAEGDEVEMAETKAEGVVVVLTLLRVCLRACPRNEEEAR